MNTAPRYQKEDILINFRDLLVHILRHWRSVLIGVLAVTLLAGGYRYLKDYQGYQHALAADKQASSTVTLEGESLANANQVLQYQKLYQAQADYNRTAPLMQLDPAAVPTRTLSYLITGARSYVTATLYQTHLGDLNPYAAIADDAAPTATAAQIRELVDIKVTYDEHNATPADHAMLTVDIVAPTDTLQAAITDAVKARLTALKATVSTSLGAHTLTAVADTSYIAADPALKTAQQNSLNTCNTLRTNLKNAKDALTGTEKAYVEQMTALDKEDDAAAPTPPSVSKKWLVLGFAAGLILMLGIHGLGYVFSQTVKSREDFAERYGLYIFGCLGSEGGKTRPTERLIRRLFFKKATATAPLIARQLALAARATAEHPTLALTGSALDAARVTSLAEALEQQGVTLRILPHPADNIDALNALPAVDAVVLAETVGASTYGDIYQALDICERLDRPVLGAIILN